MCIVFGYEVRVVEGFDSNIIGIPLKGHNRT